MVLFARQKIRYTLHMNVLIFTGGLHPVMSNFNIAIQHFKPFDTVIAADSGFDTAIGFGFECDIVVGDMDSIKNTERLHALPKDRVCEFPKDKDFTDTELALFEAKNRGAKHITLVGGDGGRLDHTLALLKSFEGVLYPDLWLCQEQIVLVLDSARNAQYTINLSENDTISIFAVANKGKITSKGLEWELNNVDWTNSAYSVSNKLARGASNAVDFTVESGRFLIVLPYSAIH